MKLELSCEYAQYDETMRINCTKSGGRCAHQRFKSCKGWCVLTPQAQECPARDKKEG